MSALKSIPDQPIKNSWVSRCFPFVSQSAKAIHSVPTSPPNLIFPNSSLPHSIPTTPGSLLDSLCSWPGTLLPNRLCTSYSLSLEWSFPQMLIWFILAPLSVLKCHLLCEANPLAFHLLQNTYFYLIWILLSVSYL